MGNLQSSTSPNSSDPGGASIPPLAQDFRQQADEQARLRNSCYQSSQEAWRSGQKDQAKVWSIKGKEHDQQMRILNERAAAEAFAVNNRGRDLSEIDLHGLSVDGAIGAVKQHLGKCRKNGVKKTVVITGRGLRSSNGVAKIKPAVEALLREEKLRATEDPRNPGCIVLELDVPTSSIGWFIEKACVIM
ncbi:DUF1771-domain-containing protein [Fimicolochytrium jonesii]|uniref:DUF1771-domain-containing protein n=1 Tax=Fimicolochytrium jonesii TaxID=1396493 RepID=UPI0022FF08F2|nr:DUF1771-domain-containing protein [Fimicolochytrium jonesii]KAI8826633.1 DUF1771-domain-containing protein [Fimicolochytrium jonesii]